MTTKKNPSSPTTVRLQVALSKHGISSRRKAATLIGDGLVQVNGRVVREKGYRVDPLKDEICVGTHLIEASKKQTHLYYLFHKPLGVTTTLEDAHASHTLEEFVRHLPTRVYPVGRLDRDSTGLLLLTNDGDLAFRLAHPRYGVEKHYRVSVSGGGITAAAKKKLENGIILEEGKTAPCRVRIVRDNEMEIALHEGKKRQIRRMCEAIGCRVVSLHRFGYGPLGIEGLKPGHLRALTAKELACLKKAAGLQ